MNNNSVNTEKCFNNTNQQKSYIKLKSYIETIELNALYIIILEYIFNYFEFFEKLSDYN